jgi:hypothetical protein
MRLVGHVGDRGKGVQVSWVECVDFVVVLRLHSVLKNLHRGLSTRCSHGETKLQGHQLPCIVSPDALTREFA